HNEKSPVTVPDVLVPAVTYEADFGVKQALRSRTFWHMGLAMMFHYAAIGTLMIHVMPYLSSIGVQRGTAGLVAMAVPVLSVVGRFASGWLGDRFRKKLI
ncbi:unnamed protein product, partial [marine sediment metagenome]